MDYIEGSTLADILEQEGGGSLPVELVLGWAEQLCDVLHYLHTRQPPIIFRDLKPSNVMISTNGHLFLIDFGIARHFKPDQAHDTLALGSIGYAAPEQYGKMQSEQRSDIYGLGALLHQLLTGRDPSNGPFYFQAAAEINPAVPTELGLLIQQMVAMEIEKRPASIRDVWSVLERVRVALSAGGGNSAPPLAASPVRGRVITSYSRHEAPVRALAWSPDGKYIASIGGEGRLRVWNATSGRTRFTGSALGAKLEHLAWARDNSYVIAVGGEMRGFSVWNARNGRCLSPWSGEGLREPLTALAFSPVHRIKGASGSGYLARIALWSIGEERLRIDTIYEGHLFFPRQVHGAVRAVSWSPDGSRIASSADNAPTVHIWNPNGSMFEPHPLIYREHQQPITALSWSPDSTRVVSTDRQGIVQIWDARSGVHLLTYSGHRGEVCAVSWSPDGEKIASAGSDGTVQIWDARSGAPRFTYRRHTGAVHAVAWSSDGACVASDGNEGSVQVWQFS